MIIIFQGSSYLCLNIAHHVDIFSEGIAETPQAYKDEKVVVDESLKTVVEARLGCVLCV
jgi:hypothetical protein